MKTSPKEIKELIKTVVIDIVIIPAILYVLSISIGLNAWFIYGTMLSYQVLSFIVCRLLKQIVLSEYEILRNIVGKLVITPVLLLLISQVILLYTDIWVIYTIIIGYILLKTVLTVIINRTWK